MSDSMVENHACEAPEQKSTEEQDGDVEMEQATEQTEEQAPTEPAMVPPEVNGDLLSQLKEMGFGHERGIRALHFSGNSTLEGAINWLEEHADDEGLDEVLLVPAEEQKPKKKLTPEEAKAKAAELQARAKAKREAEEKVNEMERERLRIRMGKELSAAARIEEEQKFKRLAEERKREKEEEARAREKIRAKLEEDRRARRRKLGLPEELTPEEQAEEEQKKAAAAAEAAKHRLPVKPVAKINNMREILVSMKKSVDQAKYMTCCKTLTAYCRNVYLNIEDLSKRQIKLENKALNERVVSVPGGLDFLKEVGFREDESIQCLVLPKEDTSYEKVVLEGAAEVLDSAMNNPMFGMF